MKKVIGTEVLLPYLDLAKPFHLYANELDHQLGRVYT
jgi:hypothetical protein